MNNYVEVLSAVVDVGAPGKMVWFAPQLKAWFEILVGDVKDAMKEENAVEVRPCGARIELFLRQTNQMLYVRPPGIYHIEVLVEHLEPASFAHGAIQFC